MQLSYVQLTLFSEQNVIVSCDLRNFASNSNFNYYSLADKSHNRVNTDRFIG